METVFANSGKVINYNGNEFKIKNSGITSDGNAYVTLEPENEKLAQRIRDEIDKRGNLTVRVDVINRLVLGEDEFPYW